MRSLTPIWCLAITVQLCLARIIKATVPEEGRRSARNAYVDAGMQTLTRAARGIEAASWPMLEEPKYRFQRRVNDKESGSMAEAQSEISGFWKNYETHGVNAKAAKDDTEEVPTMHILRKDDTEEVPTMHILGKDAGELGELHQGKETSKNAEHEDTEIRASPNKPNNAQEKDKNTNLSDSETKASDEGHHEELFEVHSRNSGKDVETMTTDTYESNTSGPGSGAPRRNKPYIIGYQGYPGYPYKLPVYMLPSGQMYTVNPRAIGNPYGPNPPYAMGTPVNGNPNPQSDPGYKLPSQPSGRAGTPYPPGYGMTQPSQAYVSSYPYYSPTIEGKVQAVPVPPSVLTSYPYQVVHG